MEIDESCQTKVSVPVNTELRFPSSTMWHDYMLTKCQLDNQSNKRKAWGHIKENETASIYNTPFHPECLINILGTMQTFQAPMILS